jgi:hypothetical protein
MSAVRSRKPRPEVWTVSSDDTIELAEITDGAVREMGGGAAMTGFRSCR